MTAHAPAYVRKRWQEREEYRRDWQLHCPHDEIAKKIIAGKPADEVGAYRRQACLFP